MISDVTWNSLNLSNYMTYIEAIIKNRGKFNIPNNQLYEVHHIIPRAFGGLPDKISHKTKHENLIWLTLSEHFEVHKILALDNLNNYKVVYAFMCMCTRSNQTLIVDAQEYAKIRGAFIEHDHQINKGKISPNKGKKYDKDYCQMISEKTKQALVNPEIRQKISEAGLGRTPWNKGKTTPDKVKQKQSLAKKGKKLSQAHCIHIGEAQKGKKLSTETKQKISQAQASMKSSHNKPIICLELNKVFYNIKAAAEELSCNYSNVVQVCKGNRKVANGYHFMYYADYLEFEENNNATT